MKYERLTTDKPYNNLTSMLNFAYAKDGDVYLRYADGEEDKRLVDYIAKIAKEKGCEHTADDILDDGCVECDCEVAVLHAVAIQAAELRARLAELEDMIEHGRLIELPCMVGQDCYIVKKDKDGDYQMRCLTLTSYKVIRGNFVKVFFAKPKRYLMDTYEDLEPERDCSMLGLFGKEWFTNIAEAEQRLAKLRGEK